MEIFRSTGIPIESKVAIVRNNMPVSTDTVYKPVMNNNDVVLVNTRNSRESFMLSRSRNNLKQFNIPQQFANQLLGIAAPAAAAQPVAAGDQARRRGRPAGQPNAPRPQQAQPAAGDINVSEEMDNIGLLTSFMRLPRGDYRKLAVNSGERVNPNGDRGAARRNNILGNSGRVGRIIKVGASEAYEPRCRHCHQIIK
jgi:hypothetical protein